MTPIFNQVQLKKPKHNVFDLSHDVKLSGSMGNLIPVFLAEVIPGDKISISNQALVRMAPMLAPMMHRVDVFFHSFFVPNRICWKGWEDFIISNTTGNTPPAFPTVNVGNFQPSDNDWVESGLEDYLGIPSQPEGLNTTTVNAIPFLAYQKIWNEYYRDQNLQDAFPYPDTEWEGLIDGDNSSYIGNVSGGIIPDGFLNTLQVRCWEHDYFTSSLPWAQKGAPVLIPINATGFKDISIGRVAETGDTATDLEWAVAPVSGSLSDNQARTFNGTPDSDDVINGSYLYAKTTDLVGEGGTTTINDLRTAYALQVFFEKAARGGTRYTEQILVHFGVKSSDARLQRPEFIGGSRSPIAISEVLNTTGTTDAPQGNMAGHGVGVIGGHHGSYFCEEHGFIITIMSILPKTAYQQGLQKFWLKFNDAYDYFFPNFAHLGEQATLNKELYTDNSDSLDDETFGYLPRFAEYRYMPSRVAGSFRSSLDFWHMGRIFGSRPSLNADFVKSNPTTRIFAVEDGDHMWMQVVNIIIANRPIPIFGSPSQL